MPENAVITAGISPFNHSRIPKIRMHVSDIPGTYVKHEGSKTIATLPEGDLCGTLCTFTGPALVWGARSCVFEMLELLVL